MASVKRKQKQLSCNMKHSFRSNLTFSSENETCSLFNIRSYKRSFRKHENFLIPVGNYFHMTCCLLVLK